MQRVTRQLLHHGPGSTQAVEQRLRSFNGCRRRRIQPIDLANPHGAQSEAKLRELAARDLRLIVFRAAQVILHGVQAQHAAWSGASRPPRSLLRRSLAYPADMER